MVNPRRVSSQRRNFWKAQLSQISYKDKLSLTNLGRFLLIDACNPLFVSMRESKTPKTGEVLPGRFVEGRERDWKDGARKKKMKSAPVSKQSIFRLLQVLVFLRGRSFNSLFFPFWNLPHRFGETYSHNIKKLGLYCKGRCESHIPLSKI